jgi:hypothetical protein
MAPDTHAAPKVKAPAMHLYVSSKNAQKAAYGSFGGVLGVIQPHVTNRGSLASAAHEMVAGRMALALRDNAPEALPLALLQAYRRTPASR